MCDRSEAMTILGEVYHACSSVLPIQDAYLYGSYARGDYRSDSDVDIMLVSPLNEDEIRKRRRAVSNIVGELCLDHDVTISVALRSHSQFRPQSLPYYQNVVREGIRYSGHAKPETWDDDVLSVSSRLIAKNRAAYEVLAKRKFSRSIIEFLLTVLIAALMLTLCSAALADMDFELRPEQKKAMQDAGRETENLLAGKEYWNEDGPEAAMILAQAGDTAQLTALERNQDGSWRIAGYNDTIPASIITSAAVTAWSISLEDNQECIFFMLKMEKYIPSTANAVVNVLLANRSLEFIWTPGRGFILDSALDVPFEDAVEGRCPYHQLTMQVEGWVYKLYEMINKENDQAWYRSEQIVEKAVPEKDLVPYAELSQLDYPAFLTFLHSLAPEEYEHKQIQSSFPEPEKPEKEDETVYVYYNPQGGRYYHADRLCPAVNSIYWPLSPISFTVIINCTNLLPCVHCNAPDRPLFDAEPTEEPLKNDAGDSDLRTLEFRYGNNGLTFLRITMNDEEKRVFTCAPLPPFCYLDTYHDGDAILIHHYAEMAQNPDAWDELAGESWFMTFEYVEDDWRLTDITNGQDWMAHVENGVYTFDDHYSDGSTWQWSAAFEDRLLVFDYAGMAKLIDRYNKAMPDRPSLHEDELE